VKFKTTTVDGVEYALVTLPKLFSLLEESRELRYLNNGGVDNWEGRDYVIDLMNYDNFHENFEDDEWLDKEFIDRG
jgi:hypothetical protein